MNRTMRRIFWILIPMVFGYLIAQYVGGQWTDTHAMVLIASIGIFLCLVVGKVVRKIIFFPINIIRRVLFRL